jgi:hypothetical protein
MKMLLATGALAVLAAPAFADEEAAATPRLSELETMVITSVKEEQAPSATTERLGQIETYTITAIKEQPKDHAVDRKTEALLAELNKEE